MSYFLFSSLGFLWEISKTHIALTTHPWFFSKKVCHASYPRDNTNNMSSYFLLIFSLGFYRSFSDISLYIAPHIFPEMVFGGVIYMSYLQYFSPLRFLMGYQWHSDLFKSHSYMLFSPYFPIRFKGVFIAYLYIHIPQIFPTGFFEEFKHTATLISKKIRSRGSVVKWRQYTNRRPSTDDLIHLYGSIRRLYK